MTHAGSSRQHKNKKREQAATKTVQRNLAASPLHLPAKIALCGVHVISSASWYPPLEHVNSIWTVQDVQDGVAVLSHHCSCRHRSNLKCKCQQSLVSCLTMYACCTVTSHHASCNHNTIWTAGRHPHANCPSASLCQASGSKLHRNQACAEQAPTLDRACRHCCHPLHQS